MLVYSQNTRVYFVLLKTQRNGLETMTLGPISR